MYAGKQAWLVPPIIKPDGTYCCNILTPDSSHFVNASTILSDAGNEFNNPLARAITLINNILETKHFYRHGLCIPAPSDICASKGMQRVCVTGALSTTLYLK